jgi:hypothetical protein
MVHERCPRACGRCGVSPPADCNMETVSAASLEEEALAAKLLSARSPVIVRLGAEADRQQQQLAPSLLQESAIAVHAVASGGRYRGDATETIAISASDFFPSLRNGSLPDDSYVFFELGGVDVRGKLGASEGFELAGTSDAAARTLVRSIPRLSQRVAALMHRQNAIEPDARDGRVLLSAGSWGNGRPFHAHGPALFTLVEGTKRWFVRRPNASVEWQAYEIEDSRSRGLHAVAELPTGWQDHLWQCTQRPGELVWVPDFHHHATLNYASEVVGLAFVIDELATPALHAAAQEGSASGVRELLDRGAAVDARASNGATALHYAAGLGHCDAADELLRGGAAIDARVSDKGGTPLHMAAGAGHERAVTLLVGRGAGLELLDEHGLTPIQLAARLGRSGIVRLLDQAQDAAARERMDGGP